MNPHNRYRVEKPIALFFVLFTYIAGQAQEKYTVSGKLDGLPKEMKVYLQYRVDRVFVNDSTITKNGVFNFEGTITRPWKATLVVRPAAGNDGSGSKVFYLTGGTTTITGNTPKSALIKGGKAQDEYMELTPKADPLQDSIDNYTWRTLGAGKDKKAAMQAKLDTFTSQMEQVAKDFIGTHTHSYVSLDLVGHRSFVITDPQSFESLYDALGTDLKSTAEGKKYAELLSLTKRLVIGQPAIDFTQNDPDGKPVSLADLKGKYVLIDFWASWCGPCRIEYPYLKKAYSQFKSGNFEIIGVSLDDKSAVWIQSIKDNGFSWPEVCDLKGFRNEVAQSYGVAAIPQSFLIDPNGIIIAKNLRGNDLIEKLKEVIK
jgi:peroxiredoxin